MDKDALSEIVEAVLRYVSATGKNELVVDSEKARDAVLEVLVNRLSEPAPPRKDIAREE